MRSETNQKSLHGIVPPVVSPLLDSDRLDKDGLKSLIDHILSAEVSGLFVLGTTGEGPSLSYATRREIIAETCKWVNQRVPVLAGITDTSLAESVSLAQVAADHGVAAVVASVPFYFSISQEELLSYFEKLAEALPLPLFLYNMPGCTGMVFEIETLKKMAAIPNICGIKDSSGDMDYFKSLMPLKDLRPDWSIFIGPEHYLGEAVLLGADGGVTGGANLFPELFVRMYQAACRNDVQVMKTLDKIIMQIAGEIYNPFYLQGLKYALSCRGLCRDVMAPPLGPVGQRQKENIRKFLSQLNDRKEVVSSDENVVSYGAIGDLHAGGGESGPARKKTGIESSYD